MIAPGLILTLLAAAPVAADPECRPARGKVSARVREQAARGRKMETLDVLLRFRSTPRLAERRLLERFGGHRKRRFRGASRWVAAKLPAAAVEALAKSPAVEFVASDEPVSPAMEVSRAASNQPGPTAPESQLKGAGVTIAMLDSGVAPHPDIQTLVASVTSWGTRARARSTTRRRRDGALPHCLF